MGLGLSQLLLYDESATDGGCSATLITRRTRPCASNSAYQAWKRQQWDAWACQHRYGAHNRIFVVTQTG
jgi:hypothetical protein